MYRVGFIGCGGIARAHAKGYAEVPECQIVAAADISQEAVDGFGEQFGVSRRFTSYEEMLAAEKPDIVSVCTWPPQHPEPVVAAARAGAKGILCEKPMALTLPEADRMNEAARAAGSILIVGHQRRFDSRYALARKLVADGAVGTLEEILAICNGDLFSDGTHAIDLMRFLAGDAPVNWVFGQIDLRQPTVTNTAHVGYQRWRETATRYGHPIEGGSLAQVQFTASWKPASPPVRRAINVSECSAVTDGSRSAATRRRAPPSSCASGHGAGIGRRSSCRQ
jgi:predicted dehydrogenase